MFDLNADEQEEVHAVQLSLYLNLAQCYLKLQSWDQVGSSRLAQGPCDASSATRHSNFERQGFVISYSCSRRCVDGPIALMERCDVTKVRVARES